MPADLFISHSSIDAPDAFALVEELEGRGITCWIAPRDVPFGSAYQEQIVEAIDGCRAMLLLFSEAANQSEHVLREVELAANARKPIYPLKTTDSAPAKGLKFLLANKQWIERKAIEGRLAETLEQLLKTGHARSPMAHEPSRPAAATTTAPAREEPSRTRSPLSAIAAGAALLIAGGLAGYLAFRPALPPVVEPVRPPVAQPLPPSAPPVEVAKVPSQVPGNTEPTLPTAQPPATPVVTAVPVDRPVSPPVAAPREISSGSPASSTRDSGPGYFRDCDSCPTMAVIPAGRALIGSPAGQAGRQPHEGSRVEVTISAAFAVSRTEVTFAEWDACVAEGGCNSWRPDDFGMGRGTRPVIFISWHDAQAYIAWLSAKTGAAYRLLSEAEWEYAARACGTPACANDTFAFGEDIQPDLAVYNWNIGFKNSPRKPAPRKSFPVGEGSRANAFGLLHMHGNVSEWVQDCNNPGYERLDRSGAAQLSGDCRYRVIRGGNWQSDPRELRSAARSWEELATRSPMIGLRVARGLTTPGK